MFFKKLFIVFYIFFLYNICHSENLLLKDGQIFKGKLYYLDKNKISLEVDNNIYDFKLTSIEYLVSNISQSAYSTIILERLNGNKEIVFLIKLTDSVLYYKKQNDAELSLVKLSQLNNIQLYKAYNFQTKQNKTRIFTENVKNINIDEDLNLVIIKLIKHITKKDEIDAEQLNQIKNNSLIHKINVESLDFYDKFWIRINKYLNSNSESLIWSLIENYSDKEKTLTLIYNDKLSDIKNNNLKSKEELSNELKNNISDIRRDFYIRAKKIILSQIL